MVLSGTYPDAKRQELAIKYSRLTRLLSLIELVLLIALLLILIFGGISAQLSYLLTFPQPWAAAIYFLILCIGLGIILMPLTYYRGFVLPRRYGLSNQKFNDWLVDRAKASALGISLGLAVVIVVYWLLGRFPDIWWIWASVLLVLLVLLLTRLTPTLLLPIFFKLEPLADVELKQRLMDLAKQVRTRFTEVFTINLSSKGTAANAMLAGLGKTRSIIISDTLLRQYSPDEIEVILAHELGHHLHRDILKLLVVEAIVIFFVFCLADLVLKASLDLLGFQGVDDVAAFPVLSLVLIVFNLMATPLVNAYSRHLEKSADKVALELTANPEAFVTAMTKLTDQNLTVAAPSLWAELLFYDHPPYTKRVALARAYRDKFRR